MKLAASCCAAILSLASISSAVAAPIKFNFVFNQPVSGGGAKPSSGPYTNSPSAPQGSVVPTMSGSITFESTLLANPGVNDFGLPNPAVLALNVTVSNSGVGDGSFTMTDFTRVIFDTNSATLNLNRQLVGQSTTGDPWGTPSGNGGDFNLFSQSLSNTNAPAGQTLPPQGEFFFTLASNGGNGPAAVLSSMVVPSAPAGNATAAAPSLSTWSLALLAALLGLGASFVLRRANRAS